MLVEINKNDLMNLVTGVDPSYQHMGHPIVKKCGTYSGSYGTWTWHKCELEKYTEEELYNLYQTLKAQR